MTPEMLVQLALSGVVGMLVWSLQRNVAGIDAKLSALMQSVRELTDHKAETREALVELRLRVAALEQRRHRTGEHEAVS